ncbi:MAG: DUF4340 domain-containing protein [Desulfobacterales bacterium]|nr:DUF4340 domain-containing protein [Desulfobacterales bacterium]MDD4072897.1 DUF4340 domain-containing protein [Desulfobacterales bacterium]MDD4392622.1 DUF4340 domain-containing protein [Desulfobacterales bacterium]
MKIKKEFIILVAVIIALSAYLFLHESDRTHYQLPAVPEIAGTDITRLEISKGDRTIRLIHKDNKWYVDPDQYLADAPKVNTMIKAVGSLTLTALVSEAESYGRYDLDPDSRITVKAWGKDALSREMEIGKAAGTQQHTFVKLPGDKNVYHARGNFRRAFDLSVDDLRDRGVLSFDRNDIREVRITKAGDSIVLNRRQIPEETAAEVADKDKDKESKPPVAGQTVWEYAEGKTADKGQLNALLGDLSGLNCQAYINGRGKQDYTNPLYTLMFKGDQEYVLSIFDKLKPEDTAYPAVSSQNDFPFTLSDYSVDDMKKKIDELLKKD